MATFDYQGRDRAGTLRKGRLVAANEQSVASQLLQDGITPIRIAAIVEAETLSIWDDLGQQLELKFGRVRLLELVMFSRQMQSLTKAGVPLIQSIAGLIESSENLYFSRILADVLERLESGVSLAGALQQHPKVFSALYVSMIAVGENTGRLDQSFQQLAFYLELEQETRKRIASAIRYPVMVLAAMLVALLVVNLKVIPVFSRIFESMRAELPWATQVLIGTSNLLLHSWHWLLLAMAGLIGGWLYFLQKPEGRLWWDRQKLSLPIVGALIKKATLARFCRSFSIMLSAGVPLNQALSIVSMVVDNSHVGARIRLMRDGIERGESLSRIARSSELFSTLVLQMMAVGEETGTVDRLLQEVAEHYEREVDFDLKRLSDAIEPVLIVFIGGLVLILALGIFVPLWDLSTKVR